MKPKFWQILVIVAGLLIGGGSVAYVLANTGGPQVQQVVHCLDVETGDLYRINTSVRPVMLPARHPTTNRICLVRVSKDDSGKWFVKSRDLAMLTMLDSDVKNAAVDATSGDLLVEPKTALEYPVR